MRTSTANRPQGAAGTPHRLRLSQTPCVTGNTKTQDTGTAVAFQVERPTGFDSGNKPKRIAQRRLNSRLQQRHARTRSLRGDSRSPAASLSDSLRPGGVSPRAPKVGTTAACPDAGASGSGGHAAFISKNQPSPNPQSPQAPTQGASISDSFATGVGAQPHVSDSFWDLGKALPQRPKVRRPCCPGRAERPADHAESPPTSSAATTARPVAPIRMKASGCKKHRKRRRRHRADPLTRAGIRGEAAALWLAARSDHTARRQTNAG